MLKREIKMIKNLSVQLKLQLGFGILLLLVTLATLFDLSIAKISKDSLNDIVYDNNAKIELNSTMAESARIVSNVMQSAILLNKIEDIKEEKKKIIAAQEIYDSAWNELNTMSMSEIGKKNRLEIESAQLAIRDINNKIITLSLDNRDEEANIILNESAPLMKKWLDAIGNNILFQKENNKNVTDEFIKNLEFSTNQLIGFTTFIITFGIFIAYFIGKSILKSLGAEPSYIASVTENIENGNLSINVKLRL